MDDLEQMKVEVPELETRSLSIRLSVPVVKVSIMCMNIKIAPFGVTKLAEECIKTGRDINSQVMMAYP